MTLSLKLSDHLALISAWLNFLRDQVNIELNSDENLDLYFF